MDSQSNSPSIKRSFSLAYLTMMENIAVVLINTLIYIIAFLISCITVIGFILVPAIIGGYFESLLRLLRGETVEIGKFFNAGFNNFGTLLGSSTIAIVSVFFGFLLFFIPGIYLCIVWSILFLVIVDQNLGIGDSLKRSRELVHLRFWDFTALIILSNIILGISGIIPLAVLFGLPFSILLIASYYNQLLESLQNDVGQEADEFSEDNPADNNAVKDSDFTL